MPDISDVLAILSGGLVGVTLGLVGGGGSILAVPLLLYVVGVQDPHVAIGTSALAVSVNAAYRLAYVGVASAVATFAPSPDTPVAIGRPVALVRIDPAATVPRTGVTSVGEVARTGEPVPVAVVHTGKAEAPPPTRISVVAPAARVWCAPVAVVPAAISP